MALLVLHNRWALIDKKKYEVQKAKIQSWNTKAEKYFNQEEQNIT